MAEVLGIIAAIAGISEVGFELSVLLYKYSYAAAAPDKAIKKIQPEVSLLCDVLKLLESILKDDEYVHLIKSRTLEKTKKILENCEAAFSELNDIFKKYMESGGIRLVDRLKWPFIEKKVDLLRADLVSMKSTLMLMLEVVKHARSIAKREQGHTGRDCEIIVALKKAEENANQQYEELRGAIANIGSIADDKFSKFEISSSNTEVSENGNQQYNVVDQNRLLTQERYRNSDLSFKLETISKLIDDIEDAQKYIARVTDHSDIWESGIWESFAGIGDIHFRHTKITRHPEMPGMERVRDTMSQPHQSSQEIRDVYIALMGAVRAGKSTFVNLCCGENLAKISQGLGQGTENIEEYHFMYTAEIRVHLIDTPGFNDGHHTDREILMGLEEWISQSHGEMTRLSGIIYFHRISDLTMQGSAHRNLRKFEKLCGTDSLHPVILVTTNWDFFGDQEVAVQHEQELQSRDDYWGLMVKRGSVILRHTGDYDSAMRILNTLVPVDPTTSTVWHQMERKRGFSQSDIGLGLQSAEAQVDELLAEYTTVVDAPPPQQRRWTGGFTY